MAEQTLLKQIQDRLKNNCHDGKKNIPRLLRPPKMGVIEYFRFHLLHRQFEGKKIMGFDHAIGMARVLYKKMRMSRK